MRLFLKAVAEQYREDPVFYSTIMGVFAASGAVGGLIYFATGQGLIAIGLACSLACILLALIARLSLR